MAERGGPKGPASGPKGSTSGPKGSASAPKGSASGPIGSPHSPELTRIRKEIDALDQRIVALLHERARLVLDAGRTKERLGRRAIRDLEREREVLLRVAMANDGPLPQADLLAFYRSLMAASRRLEAADRKAAKVRAALEGATSSKPGTPGRPKGR